MPPPTIVARGIMFFGCPSVRYTSSFRLYLLNQLKEFNQILFKHTLPDIDELKMFWRSWGQRSRSHGADFDLPYNKFVQPISTEPVEGFQPNFAQTFSTRHRWTDKVLEVMGSKVKVTWGHIRKSCVHSISQGTWWTFTKFDMVTRYKE